MPPLRFRTVTQGRNIVNAPCADAVICVSDCDKITPGTPASACLASAGPARDITLLARPDQ